MTISTLQRWGDALLTEDVENINTAFSGQGAPKKISPEIERFVISKFNEIYKYNTYDYSKKILNGVQEIFNVSLSSESIRPIIKKEKEKFLKLKDQIQNRPPEIEDQLSLERVDFFAE